jgi:hypothetical protein
LWIFLVVFREFVGYDLELRSHGGKLYARLNPDERKPIIVLGAGRYGGQVHIGLPR